MIEQQYINRILEEVDLAEVVSSYGIRLKATGHRLVGLCPFHQEKTPSFSISTEKNLWRCFGCGKGGNAINFVMEIERLSFPMAVRKLLKDNLGVSLPDEATQCSPEDEARYKKLESMRIVNNMLCSFFFEQLQTGTIGAKAAKDYMLGRWDQEYCNELRIGYAPDDWTTVVDFARKSGMSLELMQEMGVLKRNEETDSFYCMYRNRLMIPIRDRYSNIEGFTARTLDGKSHSKYINSSDSELYHKSQSIFGIDGAVVRARAERKLYLVEGAPDVMRLQSLGIPNVIASLGGSWTEKQFQMLKSFGLKDVILCFIPDSDVPPMGEKLGAGFKNVIKNGELARKLGFTVNVMEIPNDLTVEQPKKTDPDDFFADKADLAGLNEREHLIWTFEKKFDKCATAEDKQNLIKDTCGQLLLIKDKALQERYISELAKIDGGKAIWRQTLHSASLAQKESPRKVSTEDSNSTEAFGFIERDGAYWGFDKRDMEVKWSNFTMKPLFLIRDELRPVRLFLIKNDEPESRAEIVELDMEMFTSAKSLRKKLLGIGNYTWLVGDAPLIQLNSYLAKVTETAEEIKQLGWHEEGFYCFCNGALEDGVWHAVDEMGIVRLKAGIYYLPATSTLYKHSKELYANERRFRHLASSSISLHDYFKKIIDVFGDNAKIGLCFYVASLFRDIFVAKTCSFPILNIFGPKGSGKTQLGETLTSFFMAKNEPLNLATATLPALTDCVASVSNALVHLDEYKNGLDVKKIEWIKDIWGSIGRSRMNMDKDKKREQARVDAGVIITGQELPTADIALYTRLIGLTFWKQQHTMEERNKFNDLLQIRLKGATHITLEILNHRKHFADCFDEAWRKAVADVEAETSEQEIYDRIKGNWLVLLTAFLAIEDVINMPFSYEEVLKLCVKGIIKQNDECSKNDEVALFWSIICSAQQKGIYLERQDYKIEFFTKLKTRKSKEEKELEVNKKILMIRKNSSLATYQHYGSLIKAKTQPDGTIFDYLLNTEECYGYIVAPKRFVKFNSNGIPIQEQIDKSGKLTYRTIYTEDRPYCFDYDMLCRKYGVNLETIIEEDPEEESMPPPQQEELPF